MLPEPLVLVRLLAHLQIRVEQELEESADTSPGTFERLHVCEDHGVNAVGSHLDQLLAALRDLVLDEALLLLVRLDRLSNGLDLILRLLHLQLGLVDLVVVGAFRQELQTALSLE